MKPVRLHPRKNTYGWIPDLPDRRDWTFTPKKSKGRMPGMVNLRPFCSPIENQGDIGSCTAQALAGNLEFLDVRSGGTYTDISRLFIYYNERVLIRTTKVDSGAMLRDGIKTLVKIGACPEKDWPYVVSRFKDKPPGSCYTKALNHQITAYRRIDSLTGMKACLAAGYPFVFGFTVYESLESKDVTRTGTIPMPKRRERALGGHAVMAVGYDDSKGRLLIRNSWGDDWGMDGYGTLPYAYLESNDLSDDFWTITRTEGLA